MKLHDLIVAATTRAQLELDKRRQNNQNEAIALDNAEEGIRYFVELLLEEIKQIGRPASPEEIEYLQHQGPDTGDKQEDQPPQSLGASGLGSSPVESAE